ncbi:MAG: S41 family peptidase, partial [Fibrobacterota bacterium]
MSNSIQFAIMLFCLLLITACTTDSDRSTRSSETMAAVHSFLASYSVYADHLEKADLFPTPGALCNSLRDTLKGYNYTYFVEPYKTGDYVHGVSGSSAQASFGIRPGIFRDTFFIQEVYPQSPAESANLQKGDRIISVDSLPLSGRIDLFHLLTDKIGTYTLEIMRDGSSFMRTVASDYYTLPPAYGAGLNDSTGYIYLATFMDRQGSSADMQSSSGAFLQALKETDQYPFTVIDLRDNGGGYVKEAQRIASFFLSSDDTMALTRYNDGGKIASGALLVDTGDAYQVSEERDFVLLVNGGSASASELLVSALHSNLDIPIVGTRTYG